MADLWLRGGRLIDPATGWDGRGDVLIVDGMVRASGEPRAVAAAARQLAEQGAPPAMLDLAPGEIVAPGFIDLHTHLRAPGIETHETVQSGTQAAAAGGFTTLCCMPNTQPVLDDRGTLEWVARLAQGAAARVLPIAAITRGQEGAQITEMAELAASGAVAFSDDGKPVRSSNMMRLALAYASTLDRPVVNHCEDVDLIAGGVMHAGPVATRLGLRGWPAAGETIMLARDLELVRLTGGRYHAAHLSTAASVDLMRQAKAQGLDVTAEVTPHHLLLADTWVAGARSFAVAGGIGLPDGPRYATAAKVNPPLRTAADGEALLMGLLDGTIDVIATDHAPHSAVEKVCSFDEAAFGISGLETALALLLQLVHAQRLSLFDLIAALTERPARIFRLAARVGAPIGTLAQGALGDAVIFDPMATWVVDPDSFVSLGHNTPLDGITLRGRVRASVLGGKIVFSH